MGTTEGLGDERAYGDVTIGTNTGQPFRSYGTIAGVVAGVESSDDDELCHPVHGDTLMVDGAQRV